MTSVVFLGEEFTLPEKVNYRRILKLQRAAHEGNENAAGAALDQLLDHLVLPEDAARFNSLCDRVAPSAADLWKFTGDAMAAIAERPTERPSDSSDGPSSTPQSSGSSAVDRALDRWDGRPDIQAGLLRLEQRATG